MHPTDDDSRSEIERNSETRFGPRPAPKGHRPAGMSPHRSQTISRIIPSAPMSPDGRHAYPAPGLASKVIVWGGVALGVAGLTVGAILATRKVAEMIADDRPRPARQQGRRYEGPNDRALAPRFVDLDADEQEAMRSRVRAQARADDREAARQRAEAASLRNPPRGNFAKDLTQTANDLSAGLDGVARSVVTTFESFRDVASQASGIVGEFSSAAEQMRSLLRGQDTNASDRADPEDQPDDPRMHRL